MGGATSGSSGSSGPSGSSGSSGASSSSSSSTIGAGSTPSFGGNQPEVHGTFGDAAHASGALVSDMTVARLSQQLWYA